MLPAHKNAGGVLLAAATLSAGAIELSTRIAIGLMITKSRDNERAIAYTTVELY